VAKAVAPEALSWVTRKSYASASVISGRLQAEVHQRKSFYLFTAISSWSRGEDRTRITTVFNANGFIVGQVAWISREMKQIYGSLTAAAVRRFQEAHFAENLRPLATHRGPEAWTINPSYINSS
jgi:peptidoglycan hydrolase-like protein with peptidoglycan-binding domain